MMTTEQKAAPRPAWEVLREAADVVCADGDVRLSVDLKHIADRLEAAAAPKVPTLAEAVRMVIGKGVICEAASEALLEEALAREENKQ